MFETVQLFAACGQGPLQHHQDTRSTGDRDYCRSSQSSCPENEHSATSQWVIQLALAKRNSFLHTYTSVHICRHTSRFAVTSAHINCHINCRFTLHRPQNRPQHSKISPERAGEPIRESLSIELYSVLYISTCFTGGAPRDIPQH